MKNSGTKTQDKNALVSSCCELGFTVMVVEAMDDFGKFYWKRTVRCDSCKKDCEPKRMAEKKDG